MFNSSLFNALQEGGGVGWARHRHVPCRVYV
ncbi:hypothetical protein [Caudoviricetes sp.]|nr:hypothetical protein [Caudoviricetes sp.]